MTLEERLRDCAELMQTELDRRLPPPGELPQDTVIEAMRYSLLAGGKRIRPFLTLEFCRLSGGGEEAALPFACAVEMVHTYSLIHDDLPCMDDDDLRRGRPTCHKVYGEAMALLAGDGLLNRAYETALAGAVDCDRPEYGVAAAAELAGAAGILGMIGGQVLDMEGETRSLSAEELSRMHSLKTGALIKAAARMGCLAAGAPEALLQAAEDYAANLGLAFQMVDDILDVTGDPAKLGKAVGADGVHHKSTYVSLFGLEEAGRLAEEATRRAVEAVEGIPGSGLLRQLAESLLHREH